LVDGQLLLDKAGNERAYLRSLLTSFRNQLLVLKDDLLPDGKPLVEFPRIWVISLSKADLLPDLTVSGFKDLLIEMAGDELIGLREVIAGLVKGDEALAVGEDFVLLSSAKFDPEKIDVEKRIGLDLILPLAAFVPFQRHVKWAESLNLPRKVALDLMQRAEAVVIGVGLAGRYWSTL
jgi:hypothetical protein